MASGWNQTQKKVIRNNGRNTGPTIWNLDAVAAQVVDSAGHDTNDETLADSITETLHIGGFNNMLADLDAGGNNLINVLAGTAGNHGTNKTQLDAVDAKIGAIGVDFVADSFKSNGPIRHILNLQLSGTTVSIPVNTYNRHLVTNPLSGVELQFGELPTEDDPDLGPDFQVEGQVTIWNVPNPGIVTFSGLGTPKIIGEPNQIDDAAQILTYIIQRTGDTNLITLIWSSQ